jgi:hypothetical protein
MFSKIWLWRGPMKPESQVRHGMWWLCPKSKECKLFTIGIGGVSAVFSLSESQTHLSISVSSFGDVDGISKSLLRSPKTVSDS